MRKFDSLPATQGKPLFKTVHGSRLYGFAHEASDEDYYIVTTGGTKTQPKQTIVGDIDSNVVPLNVFLEHCYKGVPQSLEAMFAPEIESNVFSAFRKGYRASGSVVVNTYMRTIKNFALSDAFKSRRHALRIARNLNDIIKSGRFDPYVPSDIREEMSEAAVEPNEKYFKAVNFYSPYEVDFTSSLESPNL